MLDKDWKKDLFTIPNLLSLFRLLLIPVYVILYLNADPERPEDYFIAAAILAVSCLTDLIDGKIARHFGMISNTGKILDPLADKMTQFTLIVCLTIRHPILLVLVCLFVVKEIFQLIAGFVILRKGMMLNGALMTGKISTTVLFVSLIVLVLMPNIGTTAVNVITGVDFLFLLISFCDYIRVYFTHSPMIQPIHKKDEE
jgi:cardiolipin synthase